MFKKRILIIDDERDFTDLVRVNLEATGEFIVRAENEGAKGYDTAKEFRPDLILLDIMMPDMDGGAVLAQINGDRELSRIPVVFLTALVKPGEEGALDNRISDRPCLAKPISSAKLIAYIKEALER